MMMSGGSCSRVAMNWIFCCMPLESSSTFLPTQSAMPRRVAHCSERRFASASAQSLESAKKHEVLEHLHLLIEAALFGHIANALEVAPVERLAETEYLAFVRQGDAHHHADGRGFTCAIGAKQPEDAAFTDIRSER